MIKRIIKSLISPFPGPSNYFREFRDLFFRSYRPIKTEWGFKFGGNDQMATGLFEPVETKIFRDLTRNVDLVVNVGANIGYYCCHALSMGKLVIAIEPLSRNLYYLFKNIDINGWSKNIEIFPVACSDIASILNIWGGDTGHH